MKTPEENKKGLECCRQVNCPGDICPYYCEEYCITNMSSDAFDLIQQLEAQVPRWISVKDRLPENFEDVLVFERWRGRIFVGCFDGNEWEVYGFLAQEVTHWMPLPEPPKEEENERES